MRTDSTPSHVSVCVIARMSPWDAGLSYKWYEVKKRTWSAYQQSGLLNLCCISSCGPLLQRAAHVSEQRNLSAAGLSARGIIPSFFFKEEGDVAPSYPRASPTFCVVPFGLLLRAALSM